MTSKTISKIRRRQKAQRKMKAQDEPMTPFDKPVTLPLPRDASSRKCATQLFGAWAVEPRWFATTIEAVRSGRLQPAAAWDEDEEDDDDSCKYEMEGNVAIIHIDGQMTKRGSSFGGCSTVDVRRQLRRAAMDFSVQAILLCICSPGGTVSGTADLGDDVLAAREGKLPHQMKAKPVHAYIMDTGCSAAYWIASQCQSIRANKTAMIGSIGTYAVLEDTTGMQDQMGIRCRLVSTAPFKGLGADGKVTDEMIADIQREVNELNGPFLAAVQAGRGSKIVSMEAVADGRAHVSEQALSLGLIDAVSTLDSAMAVIHKELFKMNNPSEAFKAENPDAYKAIVQTGYDKAKADLTPKAATVVELEAAFPDDSPFVLGQLKAGASLADASIAAVKNLREQFAASAGQIAAAKAASDAAIAAKDAEIEKLTAQIGTQAAVGTGVTKPEVPTGDPKAAAKAEWDKMSADDQGAYINEDVFIRARAKELARG